MSVKLKCHLQGILAKNEKKFCFQNGRLKGHLDIHIERITSLKYIRKDRVIKTYIL